MSASELWQVKVSSGDVMTVTLDQLDAAFADGHVSESTLVREVGTVEWTTLAVVAGLVEAPPAPAPKPSAPRVDPFVVPTPMAPVVPTAPHSYAPMAMDADMDDVPFAPKRKPTAVVLGVCGACALVILAALGIGSLSGPASAASAAPAKTEAHLAVTPAASPLPAAAPVAAPAPAPEAKPADTRLTEAQKKAALAADKKLKGKASKKAAPPRKPAKDPFVKGGNKHDPLNKAL